MRCPSRARRWRRASETLPTAALAGRELALRLLVDHRERLVRQRVEPLLPPDDEVGAASRKGRQHEHAGESDGTNVQHGHPLDRLGSPACSRARDAATADQPGLVTASLCPAPAPVQCGVQRPGMDLLQNSAWGPTDAHR